jgi:hypothetical protein
MKLNKKIMGSGSFSPGRYPFAAYLNSKAKEKSRPGPLKPRPFVILDQFTV